MKKPQLCLAAVILVLSTLAAAAQATNPSAVVRTFYQFDNTHSQVFNKKAVQSRKPWFTDVLHQQLTKELERQSDFIRKNPGDKPHFGDGLPFRPLDETCDIRGRSYRFTPTIRPPINARHLSHRPRPLHLSKRLYAPRNPIPRSPPQGQKQLVHKRH